MTAGELIYRRVHQAPRELVFDCMTTPEHLTHFWGPSGTTTPLDGITVQLRPGGRFETTMINLADGSTYTMRAVYVEVSRPDRLVWTEAEVEGGLTTTVTFAALDASRTEVTTHQTNVPPPMRAPEAQAGFRTSLDRFDAYLGGPLTRRSSTVDTITSADGTTIAYSRTGSGPAVILVDGAMCYRGMGLMSALAQYLADRFTVYTYDRRGRGDSGDTQPYAVEREIEDLQALLTEAGGSAYGYAISSGAALALRSAAAGLPWRALALYEPAYTGRKDAYTLELTDLLAAGRRGDAIECFLKLVGTPAPAIAGMRRSPMWPLFEGIAPTLAYDNAVLGDGSVPNDEAERVRHARRLTLPEQTHDVAPDVLAPVLVEFFSTN
jgi:uncharacterized protein YndB with AHSA1/START domain/pimeloyl-ACP methyl ester carboxylesterase